MFQIKSEYGDAWAGYHGYYSSQVMSGHQSQGWYQSYPPGYPAMPYYGAQYPGYYNWQSHYAPEGLDVKPQLAPEVPDVKPELPSPLEGPQDLSSPEVPENGPVPVAQPSPSPVAGDPSLVAPSEQYYKKCEAASDEGVPMPKPPYSFIALISMAIANSPEKRVTVSQMYQYIEGRFPYYKQCTRNWRASVRHTLSVNDCFVRTAKKRSDGGDQGGLWAIDPEFEDMFNSGSLLRRTRRFKPGSAQWLRAKARSAKHQSSKPASEVLPAPAPDCVPSLPSFPPSMTVVPAGGSTSQQTTSLDTSIDVGDIYDILSPLSTSEDSGLGDYSLFDTTSPDNSSPSQ